MRRIFIPLVAVLALLVGSTLVMQQVSAAPPSQSATRTPTAAASPTARSTATARASATASPQATVSATETVTASEPLTPSATVTATAVITGSVLPLRFANPTEVDEARTLTVTGSGQVSAAPDRAVITIGVETLGEDVQEAVADNEERLAAIRRVITQLDIPARNVQTSNYSIVLERDPAALENAGNVAYRVSQQLTVRVDDLSDNAALLGDLIGGAVEAGANSVFGPSFELSDTTGVEQAARRAAVEDAYARAQDWATLTGVELIGVARVTESAAGGPIPVERAVAADAIGGSNLETGSVTYSEQVQIVFYIR